MTALSITDRDRELLTPSDLERLEELLDFDTGEEYPHEYPPGYAVPIHDHLPIELADLDP